MAGQRNAEGAGRRALTVPGHQRSRVDVPGLPYEYERQWPGTLMALGVFVAIFTFWTAVALIFISITDLVRLFALFAFAGNLLPFAWTGGRFRMARLEWFFFNLLVVGPFVFAFLVGLNVLVHGPTEVWHLTNGRGDPVRQWRDEGAAPSAVRWNAAAIDPRSAEELEADKTLFGKARGCLGYDVVTSLSAEDLEP